MARKRKSTNPTAPRDKRARPANVRENERAQKVEMAEPLAIKTDLMGAEIYTLGGNVQNPAHDDDPRFDPAMDAENALAHGEPVDDEAASVDAEAVQKTVQRALERAKRHWEEDREPDATMATDYYMGRPFGDEEEGRSKVVSTDVRDATQAQLPSLMRVFFGPEDAVEFRPRQPNDEALAAQATEYINYVIREDNPGFLIFHSAFKDALVRRLGVFKWWHDESYRVEASNYTGLDMQGVALLLQDEGVGAVEVTSTDPAGMTFDVRVTRKSKTGCPKFAAVPPEEFWFTPGTRSLEEAPLVAHVREVPRDELVQMGIDEDLIEEAEGKTKEALDEDMEDSRRIEGGAWDRFEDESLDQSQTPILFAEAYCLVDGDGDDVAELRMFQCVGPDFRVANGDGLGEIVDEVPFATLTPEPEPHTLVGLSNFDLLRDVQRVKSQVLRGTLNSLALSVEPQLEVVEGEVNMQDVLNPEIAGVIRARRPGMLREIKHTFVGPDALPVLAYYDEIRENRTGQTKAAQGLDADSLQSATKAAVAATLSAAQQRVEMIARIFAETGVRRLFKGLLRLVVKHQDQARMVRLRDQWVPIDPRHWDATMDVSVNVALGSGTAEEKIQVLAGILSAQKELMASGSPLTSNVEIRHTLGKATELAGFRNSDAFFRPWGPEQEQQMQEAMAQQQPPPDPNMMLVQIEQARQQVEAQVKQAELMLKKWEAERQDDRERDKIARDAVLKERELELKHAADINDAELRAQVQRDRQAQDANQQAEAA